MEDRSLPRCTTPFYSEETIIEEKDKRGNVVNKYVKGRYLGKVHLFASIGRLCQMSLVYTHSHRQEIRC